MLGQKLSDIVHLAVDYHLIKSALGNLERVPSNSACYCASQLPRHLI